MTRENGDTNLILFFTILNQWAGYFVNETGEQTKPDLHKLRQFDTESTDIAISELS